VDRQRPDCRADYADFSRTDDSCMSNTAVAVRNRHALGPRPSCATRTRTRSTKPASASRAAATERRFGSVRRAGDQVPSGRHTVVLSRNRREAEVRPPHCGRKLRHEGGTMGVLRAARGVHPVGVRSVMAAVPEAGGDSRRVCVSEVVRENRPLGGCSPRHRMWLGWWLFSSRPWRGPASPAGPRTRRAARVPRP
jgi:hypothetical protein